MAFLSVPAAWRHTTTLVRSSHPSRCTRRPMRTTHMQLREAQGDVSRSAIDETRAKSDPELDLSEMDDGVVDVLGADYDLVDKPKTVRRRTRELLSEIEREGGEDIPADADSLPRIEDDETMAWVRTVVRAGDERKARDPMAIRVMRVTYITSFVVALNGRSEPQVRAIANLVEENMTKEHGIEPKRMAGTAASGWILLDYGDMMVNIFTPEQRKYYNLEALWKNGEVADISDCITGISDAEDEEEDESLDDWIS